jgi:hypothetical protein
MTPESADRLRHAELSTPDVLKQFEDGVALEGILASDEVVQSDPARPDVDLEAGEALAAVGDLRRLEGRGALARADRVVRGEGV